MMRYVALLLAVLLLPSCRDYDLQSRVAGEDGLVPADQFARYGREQAEKVAIARQFAAAAEGGSLEERTRQVETAATYARSLPDVADVVADSQGNWLNVQFRSGWLVAVTPVADGKSAADTPNLPSTANPPAPQ
jgi:hypothetical protein